MAHEGRGDESSRVIYNFFLEGGDDTTTINDTTANNADAAETAPIVQAEERKAASYDATQVVGWRPRHRNVLLELLCAWLGLRFAVRTATNLRIVGDKTGVQ